MDEQAIKTEADNGEMTAEEKASARDAKLAAAYDLDTAEETETDETPIDDTEDQKVEPEKAEPEPDDEEKPLPHPESSRLGRKVARLDGVLKDRDREIEILKAEINQMKGYIQGKQGEEEPLDPEEVATIGSVEKIIRREFESLEKKKADQKKVERDYQTKYENLLADKADDDPEIFDEIVELLSGDTPFNLVHVDGYTSPQVDLEINYNKAKAHILSQASKKDKPNLKGERAKGTKVGDTDKVDAGKQKKSVDLSSLDAESKAFLDYKKRQNKETNVQALADKALGEK